MLSLSFFVSKMRRELHSVSHACHVWVELEDNISQRSFAVKCKYKELVFFFPQIKILVSYTRTQYQRQVCKSAIILLRFVFPLHVLARMYCYYRTVEKTLMCFRKIYFPDLTM